ncbi:hypothetical protein [Pseudomonas sp. QD4]|uniref:hypothetical protein n=1 Tax=Pseudomonas sp. QD4 TaxID=3368618 RepID=UPI003BA2E663
MIFGPSPIAFMYLYLLLILCGASAAGLVSLVMALRHPEKRQRLRKRLWLHVPLTLAMLFFVGLGLKFVWGMVALSVAQQERTQALNPRLQADLQLDELHFPAGTLVKLDTLDPVDWKGESQLSGLQSVAYATFKTPQSVLGLQVSDIDMPPHYYFSKLLLVGDQQIAGWPCKGGGWVSFDRTVEDRTFPSRWRFDECHMSPDARLADVTWPAGSQVFHESSGFIVRTDGEVPRPVAYQGMQFLSLTLDLDENQQLRQWSGVLAQPVQLGEWHYPAGMRVRQEAPDRLLFSPTRESTAVNHQTRKKLSVGRSILQQRADGAVLDIQPNDKVGVIDWEEFGG